MGYQICFNSRDIRRYLKQYGRGPYSQDDDLMLACVMAKFHEKEFGGEYLTCFELKEKYSNEYGGTKKINIEEMRDIFNNRVEKDTPKDFIIMKNEKVDGKFNTIPFQFKRIVNKKKSPTTDSIVDYINNIKFKYYKTNIYLLIAILTDQRIELDQIKNRINTKNYPFSKIMFYAMSGNDFLIGEIWPKDGYNTYSLQDLIG